MDNSIRKCASVITDTSGCLKEPKKGYELQSHKGAHLSVLEIQRNVLVLLT